MLPSPPLVVSNAKQGLTARQMIESVCQKYDLSSIEHALGYTFEERTFLVQVHSLTVFCSKRNSALAGLHSLDLQQV